MTTLQALVVGLALGYGLAAIFVSQTLRRKEW